MWSSAQNSILSLQKVQPLSIHFSSAASMTTGCLCRQQIKRTADFRWINVEQGLPEATEQDINCQLLLVLLIKAILLPLTSGSRRDAAPEGHGPHWWDSEGSKWPASCDSLTVLRRNRRDGRQRWWIGVGVLGQQERQRAEEVQGQSGRPN